MEITLNTKGGLFMSTGLITFGTGVTSFAAGIVLTLGSRNRIVNPMIAHLAIGAAGLFARKKCLEQDQNLSRKDYILIGGGALVGGFAGHATAMAIIACIAGRMMGSLMFSAMGNIMMMPFNIILAACGKRPVFFNPDLYPRGGIQPYMTTTKFLGFTISKHYHV